MTFLLFSASQWRCLATCSPWWPSTPGAAAPCSHSAWYHHHYHYHYIINMSSCPDSVGPGLRDRGAAPPGADTHQTLPLPPGQGRGQRCLRHRLPVHSRDVPNMHQVITAMSSFEVSLVWNTLYILSGTRVLECVPWLPSWVGWPLWGWSFSPLSGPRHPPL